MKIWRLFEPRESPFARASRCGSWSEDQPPIRVRPLIIEWEPGSDLVGDFTWPGFGGDLVTRLEIGDSLQRHFGGFEPSPIQMIESKGNKTRKRKGIKLPYNGPSLCEIWVTAWIHVDHSRSTLHKVEKDGAVNYSLQGAETWETSWNPKMGKLERRHLPREAGAGIFFPEKEIYGSDFFKLYELPGWIFCNQAVKDHIEIAGYNNICFLDIGETF